MTFLLDINVLIALIDPAHVDHEAAHRWFEAEGRRGLKVVGRQRSLDPARL